jgi:concanavalin A-like lectin/glucanase superfamily protein
MNQSTRPPTSDCRVPPFRLTMKAVAIVAVWVLQSSVMGAPLPLAGISAQWPADGNATDVVGSNNGTLQNGASFDTGQFSQAFDLTGPSDLVRMSQPLSFTASDSFTVSLWMNQAVTPANQSYILETRLSQSRGFAILMFSNNKILVGGRADNAFILGGGSQGPLNNGQWYHVAAVFDRVADELRFYLDGSLQSTQSLAAATGFTLSDKLFLGAISSQNASFNFNGHVDEVQIYDRALVGTEVQSLVPEPGILSMLVLGGMMLARRRRCVV